MAYVTKKQTDSRYKHLEKLYKDDEIKPIKADPSDTKEITIHEDSLKITRKDVLKNLLIVLLFGVLGMSGYLLSRFI